MSQKLQVQTKEEEKKRRAEITFPMMEITFPMMETPSAIYMGGKKNRIKQHMPITGCSTCQINLCID